MRVLHLTAGYPPIQAGGSYLYVKWLHEQLLARGMSSHVITRSWGLTAPLQRVSLKPRTGATLVEEIRGVRCHNWDNHWDLYTIRGQPRVADVLRETIAVVNPDVVHAHSCDGLPVDMFAALPPDLPLILTHHDYWLACPRTKLVTFDGRVCPSNDEGAQCGPCCWEGGRTMVIAQRVTERIGVSLPRHSRPARSIPQSVVAAYRNRAVVTKRVIFSAAANIFPTPDAQLALERLVGDVPRAAVIPLPVPSDFVRSGAADARPHSPVTLAFLGSDSPLKGLATLLDAVEGVAGVELKLLGHYGRHTRARIKASPALSRVEIIGPYDRADLPKLLAMVDLGIVPSLWEETGPPMVTTEFHALGIPVMASDLGGMRMAVIDRVNGRRFARGDSRALRTAIEEVRNNPAVLAQWRQRVVPWGLSASEHVDAVTQAYRAAQTNG